MRVMLYSQHVLGVGHFFRSMEIAGALHSHEVLFVEGGEPVPDFAPPGHVKRGLLPSLMMDAEFTRMEAHDGEVQEIKARRRELLMKIFLDFRPEVLITELFPFGRKQFRFELIPLLEAIREGKVSSAVVCSLRDLLVEKSDQEAYERRVLDQLNHYYHLLLVHSDPALIRLDETFERTAQIRIPVLYTGFVVRKVPKTMRRTEGRTIVVSSGGGKVGADLLESAILAFRTFDGESLHMKVFLGPFMELDDRSRLFDLAKADRRILIHPFTPDFLSELADADLSISMAGYNTCMDILSVGLKALVYPFAQNREQAMRSRKLEELGMVKVLENLHVEYVAKCIREALEGPMPKPGRRLDLTGAKTTALLLEQYFAEKTVDER